MGRTDSRPPAVFLMGPTAAGKTDLACGLADRFPFEIVSVDSALVYRGMDIGTAKPDAETRKRHPHALVDIRDPAEAYSAAQFRTDALAAMQAITERGAVPLLVGGTGLYFRALQRGLSPLPEADANVRSQIAARGKESGWPKLHAELAAADPAAAARIRPNDRQRIQRALEVIALTGKSLTAQLGQPPQRFAWRVLKLAVIPPRAELHRRIAMRLDAMLEAGLLEEVRRLRARGDLHPELPSMRAVGYRQAWWHLDGATDADAFRAEAVSATRQLAKRQTTWLRSCLDLRWLPEENPLEHARGTIFRFLPQGF